jgi:hypothetical protein
MSADIEPFLDEFSEQLLQHLPNGMEPNVDNRLVDIRMSRTNKRNIKIYIQTRGSHILEITYGMPVPAAASRVFQPSVATIAPTQLQFADHAIRRGYNHIQNLRITDPLWDDEIDRLNQAQYDHPVGSAPRKQIANILRYWRLMKGRIMSALANGGVDTRGPRIFHRFSPSSNRPAVAQTRRRRSSQGTTPSSNGRRRSRSRT